MALQLNVVFIAEVLEMQFFIFLRVFFIVTRVFVAFDD